MSRKGNATLLWGLATLGIVAIVVLLALGCERKAVEAIKPSLDSSSTAH